MAQPAGLRERAETLAGTLPPLYARAQRLANTVVLGTHGHRRPGRGDDFWEYRLAQPGDAVRAIDWRRSARSDDHFVREQEWQIAQSVMLWVDCSASMRFASTPDGPQKLDRARLLALASAIALVRSGERVGLSDGTLAPGLGRQHLLRLANELQSDAAEEVATPALQGLRRHARALFVSDFLADEAHIRAVFERAAGAGVRGLAVQVLDPVEESFPYQGRTVFESVGGTLRHDTFHADGLRDRYLERLARRKELLVEICARFGWRYHLHHTSGSARSALHWIHNALETLR